MIRVRIEMLGDDGVTSLQAHEFLDDCLGDALAQCLLSIRNYYTESGRLMDLKDIGNPHGDSEACIESETRLAWLIVAGNQISNERDIQIIAEVERLLNRRPS